MVSGELCAKRLVFVDEMGSNTFASRALRLFSEGREGVLLGGAKPGQEHDAAL
jgi:hypothetical protein